MRLVKKEWKRFRAENQVPALLSMLPLSPLSSPLSSVAVVPAAGHSPHQEEVLVAAGRRDPSLQSCLLPEAGQTVFYRTHRGQTRRRLASRRYSLKEARRRRSLWSAGAPARA